MPRGRKAQPAEVKALKGNPGKRRLALDQSATGEARTELKPLKLQPPDFLKTAAEIETFKRALAWLPANVARKSDVWAFGRWAAWMQIWIAAKLALDGKAHWYEAESQSKDAVKVKRDHPLSKKMSQAEAHLMALEDRLGLNVVARNSIVHRLFQMPGAAVGTMFDEVPPEQRKDDTPLQREDEQTSPLGFLQTNNRTPH